MNDKSLLVLTSNTRLILTNGNFFILWPSMVRKEGLMVFDVYFILFDIHIRIMRALFRLRCRMTCVVLNIVCLGRSL